VLDKSFLWRDLVGIVRVSACVCKREQARERERERESGLDLCDVRDYAHPHTLVLRMALIKRERERARESVCGCAWS